MLIGCLLLLVAGDVMPAQVSPATAERLRQATQMLEQGQHTAAERSLQTVLASDRETEQALALRLLAWSDLQQGHDLRAIGRYRDLLQIDALDPDLREEATRNLAQLLFEAGRHREVSELLEPLAATSHDSGLLLTLAESQWQSGRRQASASTLQQVIRQVTAGGQVADEALLVRLRAIQFAQQDWDGLRNTLQLLVAHYPKRIYWLHLADTWRRLGQPARQVATLELAHLQGALEPADLRLLARTMMAAGTPARASRLLQEQIDNGELPPTAETLYLLYRARWQAREEASALEALAAAARAGNNVAHFLQLARHRIEREQWAGADEALQAAVDAGALTNHAADIALLRGIVFSRQGQFEQALLQLRAAQRDPATRAQAQQWLDYAAGQQGR